MILVGNNSVEPLGIESIYVGNQKVYENLKTVELSGTFSSSNGYVTIDGTKYTSSGTYSAKKGDVVSIYVSGSSSQRQNCYVELNGETVKSGYGEYNHTVTKDCIITMTRNGSTYNNYYSCEITE